MTTCTHVKNAPLLASFLILPQTNAEKALANKIFKEGGLLGVGAPVLMPNIVTIKKVAKKAQNMIDGLGVKRILTLIEEIIE